jgi:hypothetical protein
MILNLTWPVRAEEIDAATWHRQMFRLYEQRLETQIERDAISPEMITLSYRRLVENGLMDYASFFHRIAFACGYVPLYERDSEPFCTVSFGADLRRHGAPDLAELWERDRAGFERMISKGREYAGGFGE